MARAPGRNGPCAPAAGDRGDRRDEGGSAHPGRTAEARNPDIDGVHIETWPFGGLIPEALADGKRLVWTPIWERKTPDDNQYAHPVYGLYAVIDLDTGTVIDVEDHGEMPVPQESGHYRQSQLGHPRALRVLEITQPDGPSFTVDGWRVEWQKWAFRIGFCPREGLLIHDVRYDDDGTERRIAHRMSIAELVIPYGDPSPGSYRKNAFDTGEVGVGYYTNSLTLGCDCLGEIRYLDVTVADPTAPCARSRTGSACMRRTPGSSGSTPTPTATSRCGGAAASWHRRS